MWLIVEEAVCRQCRNHTHDEIVDRPVPMTPSHRPLPISSQAFEHFVGITSEIVADRNHRRVHEADACTTTEGGEVKKEHHLEEHAALEFHESVVGYGIGKIGLQMLPDEDR